MLAFAILIKPYLIWLLLNIGRPSKEISSKLLSRNISNNININYTYYTYITYKLYIYPKGQDWTYITKWKVLLNLLYYFWVICLRIERLPIRLSVVLKAMCPSGIRAVVIILPMQNFWWMVLHVAANETEGGTNGVELSTELLLVTSGLLEVSFKHKIHETCPLSCMYSGVGSFAICYFTIYKSFRVYKNTYCSCHDLQWQFGNDEDRISMS